MIDPYGILKRPLTKKDIPILANIVKNPKLQFSVRKDAIIALGKIGPAAAPALLPLLSHVHPGVRQAAAKALGSAGVRGAKAIKALSGLLQDEDVEVRRTVVTALRSAERDALPALLEALKDADEEVQTRAILGLSRYGPEIVPVLLKAYSACRADNRRYILQLLGEHGPAASEALPLLEEALLHRDHELRRAAAVTLGKIGPAALPALLRGLDKLTFDQGTSRIIVECLIPFGPQAHSAVPRLIGILRTSTTGDHLRLAAINALVQISPGSLYQTLPEIPLT
jgi:HEAT repeat protein